jgi:uncharacterized protein (DUF58 family)
MIQAVAHDLAAPHAAVILAAEQLVAAAGFSGGHGVRRAGAGSDFWAYAPYRTGDDTRRIDWRRSARQEGVIVRQYERLAPRTLTLWCDPSAGMDWSSHIRKPTKQTVAYCVAMAAALVFSKGGERIHAGPERAPAWSGLAVRNQILPHLMANKDEPAPQPHADILMISDGLDARWPDRLQTLEHRGTKGVLALVSDPAERDFPYTDPVAFETMSGRRRHLLHDPAAVQIAYRTAYRNQMDRVVRNAQTAGFPVVHIDSHGALEPSFITIVRALSGQSI